MLLDSQKGEDLVAGQDPPPYTGLPFTSREVTSDFAAVSRRSAPTLAPGPSVLSPFPQSSVSQLHIFQKHGSISGTFYIDPRAPSGDFNIKGGKVRKENPLHASFRTRHGPISLNLGTIGDACVASHKANVLVSSRHGDINVKLLPTSPSQPTLGLEVKTRRGGIVLFVSRDFSGAIQLSSYKGRIEFLPAFASLMRVMKQSQSDALIMFGDQMIGDTQDLNYCELKTRRGKVVIGLSDVDKYDPVPSFWKRLFGHS